MLSALILSVLSYPAMPLAEQLVHQRYVHPGPLVLRTAPLNIPAPATDRDYIQQFYFEYQCRERFDLSHVS